MLNYFEKIARIIYKERKDIIRYTGNDHPDEESLACLLEDKLSRSEKDTIQKHLLICDSCAQNLSTQLKIQPHLSMEVPVPLLEKIKALVIQQTKENLFEIFLKLKDKALEIIQTTGDVLVGQELIPAPVLRSRKISEFKEEVNILKDLAQIRVLVKIENKNTASFNLTITVKDKQTRKVKNNLRVTLLKDEIELESYIAESGNSVFENIAPGNYSVQINQEDQIIALINLEVKA